MNGSLALALRTLRRTPGFTAVAVGTLALGIGATTTIFTVVNGVLLRPLPYEQPERVAMIWNDLGEGAQSLPAVSALDFLDYRERSRAFQDFAAASGPSVVRLRGNLTGEGDPERVDLAPVTANFFPLLGVAPILGRTFTAEEEQANGPRVALLSHRLWQRRYGGDPSLVGRTIAIDGIEHVVVGVLPETFRLHLPAEAFLLTDAEVWTPLQFDYGRAPPRNFTGFTVFGRLAEGASWEQARAEMDGIAAQLRAEHPVHAGSNLRIRVVPLHHDVVKHARPALLVLMGAVALVLLIACANVANLLLTRAAAREGEFALRAALGAGRRALARQLLAESGVLAVAGGALGLGATFWAMALLRALRPANLPRLADIRVDATVLGFALLVSLATVVVFALVPALRAAGADPHGALQHGTRGTGGRERQRIRDVLIVAEVALSVVLLVGAGLLMRSFLALQGVRPGFEANDVLTFQLALPAARYPSDTAQLAFYQRLDERLRALPGVRTVAQVSKLPLTGSGTLQPFAFDEETARNWESVTADERVVSPGFFDAVDAGLVAGRAFTDRDAAGAPRVAMVDETLARLAWPGENPVGKRLQVEPTGSEEPFVEIVGVVEHLRMNDLSRQTLPQIYWPLGQSAPSSVAYVIEAATEPAALGAAVRQAVAELDRDLPVSRLAPMTDYVSANAAQRRFSLILMAALGGIALLLAAVGVFGVISYSVSQRTREFGIRLALGEDPGHTRRSVVLGGMRVVALAIGLGLAAALAGGRYIAGLLYGVRAADPLTFGAIAVLLALVAMLACYLPARRATRVDPALALRGE
ncbi:MAG TPA: ABC transporter permease [Gemmatimonadales bacterium]